MKLKYDCHAAHLAGETRNPWVVLRELGITFGDSEGMAIADACFFMDVDASTLPDPLPSYLEIVDRGE